MKQILFTTECKNKINRTHEINLRSLYMPIIGSEATSLYSLLLDYHILNINDTTLLPLSDLSKTLRVSDHEIHIFKNKLEAVGLIRTFESSNGQNLIFLINAPLSPENFKKNQILFNHAMKQINDVIFERLFFKNTEKKLNKDGYLETTAKFSDIFDLNDSNDIGNTTLEFKVPQTMSKSEIIRALTPSQFIKHISGNKVSPSQFEMVQRVLNSGLSSASINEIINYSFELNTKIVSNHIETIANDMISKSITNPEDIKSEMNSAKKSISMPLEIASNIDSIDADSNATASSWKELFDSLGGEL